MKKAINRLRLFKDYLDKKPEVSGLPIELVIEATNKCNLNCIMCVRKVMKRPIGFMDFDLYRKIIDQISPYVELIYLHGLGEPLFHPKIFEMVHYAKTHGLNVGISTNATLLTKEKSQKLIDSGLDYLIIALDAARPETFKKVRGGNNFKVVVSNTKQFLKLKKQTGRGPFTVLQFVKNSLNLNEVEEFRKQWRNQGAEVIRVKPVIDLLREGQLPKKVKRPCYYIWRQLNMIGWNGKIVTPCCMDTNGDYNLGDVTTQTIKEIWNSPKMIALRKLHAQDRWQKSPLCANCTYPQPSMIGKLGAMVVPETTIKKVLPLLENVTFGKFVIVD